ncbi:hypothetical protein BP5796_07910 [Coleophoma crateriformis]|uniref:Xylanolytic transcriptional activator regulatory domain-containing protein n=1 Tax=Coleophoma crateriformis TaxID=565419 RepID=A0A3D8RD51_9HELO|nr:hypothetical protein BP5796_07910 [Coleophoma crateriformis]
MRRQPRSTQGPQSQSLGIGSASEVYFLGLPTIALSATSFTPHNGLQGQWRLKAYYPSVTSAARSSRERHISCATSNSIPATGPTAVNFAQRHSSAASSPDVEDAAPDPTNSPENSGSDRNSIGFLLNCSTERDFMTRFPKSVTLSPHPRAANLAAVIPGVNGYHALSNAIPNELKNGISNDMNNGIPPGISSALSHSLQHGLSGGVATGLSNGMGNNLTTEIANGIGNGQNYEIYGNMEGNVDLLLSSLEFESFEKATHNWPGMQVPGILWSSSNSLYIDRSVLEQRASDIRQNLYRTATSQAGSNLPPKEVVEAIEYLSADKIAAYIKLYFQHWHKHGPIVHEPSFNPCMAAVPLVLVLMALGAMYSKEPHEVQKIQALLDTIETYIYSLPGLSEEYDLPGRIYPKPAEDVTPEWQQYQLEEMQGAYLMIVLQYWTGTETARKRVRQARFTRIVEIYRYLGMHTVQHPANFSITDEHSFRMWIRKEAYIRTATIAMMLDNAFGIFNNITPRLQWSEIDLPFPSEDRYFNFASYDEMLADGRFPTPKPKIKDAFVMLFSTGENWEEDLRPLRSGILNAMDMQMLMHINYTYFWTHTFASPFSTLPHTSIPTLLAPFKKGMQNWKHLWNEIKFSMPLEDWNALGFQRTAEIYYDAVKAIIQIFERREGNFPYIPSDCEKGSHLRLLLSF